MSRYYSGNPLSAHLHNPRVDRSTRNEAVLDYVVPRMQFLGIPVNWDSFRAFVTEHCDEIAQATGSVVLS